MSAIGKLFDLKQLSEDKRKKIYENFLRDFHTSAQLLLLKY